MSRIEAFPRIQRASRMRSSILLSFGRGTVLYYSVVAYYYFVGEDASRRYPRAAALTPGSGARGATVFDGITLDDRRPNCLLRSTVYGSILPWAGPGYSDGVPGTRSALARSTSISRW